MTHPLAALRRLPLVVRLILGTLLLAVLFWASARFVPEPSERFWLLVPVAVLVLAGGLQVIPAPRWPEQSPRVRTVMIGIMCLFPVLIYSGLVWLTDSPFDLWESLVVFYFFVFCLELPLLYFFNGVDALDQRIGRNWTGVRKWLARGGVRILAYLPLIPMLLAVFAIHRPKLRPVPFTFIDPRLIEPVQFPSREERPVLLRGDFLRHPEPRGTVLICHGVGANRGDISAMVEQVYDCGFHVFAFDFRGHGESDGHTVTYGIREKRDIQGAYDELLSRPDVASGPIYALGISMGGGSLLLALPELPQIRAAMVDSAFADLRLMVHHQLRFFPAFLRAGMVEIARLVAWLETGADLTGAPPWRSLAEIDIPLTIVHGQTDTIVPVEQSELLIAHCRNLSSLHTPPETGHIATVLQDPWRYRQLIQSTFVDPARTDREEGTHGPGRR